MTSPNPIKSPHIADSVNDAMRAAAEASRSSMQSAREAANLSRDLFEQSVGASRKMFAVYTEAVTAGIQATFEVQNAALSAGLTLLETAGATERHTAAQFLDSARQSQEATLRAWQSGVRAAEKIAAGGGPA